MTSSTNEYLEIIQNVFQGHYSHVHPLRSHSNAWNLSAPWDSEWKSGQTQESNPAQESNPVPVWR